MNGEKSQMHRILGNSTSASIAGLLCGESDFDCLLNIASELLHPVYHLTTFSVWDSVQPSSRTLVAPEGTLIL